MKPRSHQYYCVSVCWANFIRGPPLNQVLFNIGEEYEVPPDFARGLPFFDPMAPRLRSSESSTEVFMIRPKKKSLEALTAEAVSLATEMSRCLDRNNADVTPSRRRLRNLAVLAFETAAKIAVLLLEKDDTQRK